MPLDTADIVAIQQLEAFCHHAVDHTDQSLLPLAFSGDARFDTRGCGGHVYEGIDAIVAFFALGKPPHPPSHHMTNCVVYEKDGEIRVMMKWQVPAFDGRTVYGGRNDDVVISTPDGWRIKQRVAMQLYPADNKLGADGYKKAADA
jgi:SnoaL-like domain